MRVQIDLRDKGSFEIWKKFREDKRKRAGAYWITDEGRKDIRDTCGDSEFAPVLLLLNALEDLEFRSGLKAQFVEATD